MGRTGQGRKRALCVPQEESHRQNSTNIGGEKETGSQQKTGEILKCCSIAKNEKISESLGQNALHMGGKPGKESRQESRIRSSSGTRIACVLGGGGPQSLLPSAPHTKSEGEKKEKRSSPRLDSDDGASGRGLRIASLEIAEI